jgi:uncharacterized protein
MAGSSLFALLDDIATLLDDVSVMTKIAAKKTAGVLGDDLALNAQQVSGVRAARELPIVWAVAKGSMRNKVILVPLALLLSAIAPQLIGPILVLGGLFLCYEGAEKIWHHLAHSESLAQNKEALHQAAADTQQDLALFEADKVKGAIRTDFILSAEIIVITLGTAAQQSLEKQAIVVSLIAIAMTVGVYGLVALIVKLDDIGIHLMQDQDDSLSGSIKRKCGSALLAFCPKLMKTLSIVGTAAMFLVGGGIIAHEVSAVHHWLTAIIDTVGFTTLTSTLFNALIGLVSGALVLASLSLFNKVKG